MVEVQSATKMPVFALSVACSLVHVDLLQLGLQLGRDGVHLLLGLLLHKSLPAAANVLSKAAEARPLVTNRLHQVVLERGKARLVKLYVETVVVNIFVIKY